MQNDVEDLYEADPASGTIYRDGVVFAAIHPGQGGASDGRRFSAEIARKTKATVADLNYMARLRRAGLPAP